MVAKTAIFFGTPSNFISKDMLRWSNITETLLIVRLEGSNRFGKHLFVCVSFFFFFNKNKNKTKKIGWADLNKFLLREIKVFKCPNSPNIVPPPPTPQIGKASITISWSRWAASSMLCLFVCFCPFHSIFSQTLSRGKRKRQTQMTQSS